MERNTVKDGLDLLKRNCVENLVWRTCLVERETVSDITSFVIAMPRSNPAGVVQCINATECVAGWGGGGFQ